VSEPKKSCYPWYFHHGVSSKSLGKGGRGKQKGKDGERESELVGAFDSSNERINSSLLLCKGKIGEKKQREIMKLA